MSSMLVVGSVAFDTIHNHLGSHNRVLGGSATYASIAAGLFSDHIHLVGVVGTDFDDKYIQQLRKRGIDTDGLEIANGETFHWEGRYSDDLTSRETLRTDLNVFANFDPKIPESYRNCEFVMLGNIHPSLQLRVLDQIEKPQFVIADTMNFWIEGNLPELKKVLSRINMLVVNDEEARQLTGHMHMLEVAAALHEMGPDAVIIKRGEYGAMLFLGESNIFSIPAYPIIAIDPTGAGDSFAGGFLGSLTADGTLNDMTFRNAVVSGSAVASLCVEGVGPQRLLEIDSSELQKRREAFKTLTHFG